MYFFFEGNKKPVKESLYFLPRTQEMPLVENDPFLKGVWLASVSAQGSMIGVRTAAKAGCGLHCGHTWGLWV